MKKSIVIAALLFMVVICVNAQSGKRAQGLLWKISGNGLSKPSYLYGTMHVSSKMVFRLSDSFFTCLKGVASVALESNPDGWMDELLDEDIFREMQRAYSNSYYNGDFYKEAFLTPYPERLTIAQMFMGDKALINQMLYRFDNGNQDYEEDTYLDLFIYQSARKIGKPVASLEDFKQTMLLYGKAQKAALKEDISPSVSSDLYEKGVNIQDLMEDGYRKGDLEMLDSLNRLTMGKNFRKYFIETRNKIMARGMDSIMKTKTLFTAVGAAHLPGEFGVINLLRKMGYTVRAVDPQIGRNSGSERSKFEKMSYPVTFSTQYAEDSAFSVDVPGKLFALPMYKSSRDYLFPEMVNGAYYSVSRLATYGGFYNRSQKDIMQSLDTLLFERVPGKLLKKKEITSNNGYPGYDISAKTRRGDIVRYQVFVSPQEIIVFMMGGNGEYVKTRDGERFFSSIHFNGNTAAGWHTFSPPSGGYAVSMPGKVLYTANTKGVTSNIQRQEVQSYDASTDATYLLIRSSFHDFDYIEEDSFELRHLAERFLEQFNAKAEKKELLKVNGYPAMDVKGKKENGSPVYLLLIIQGPHYYLMAVGSDKADRSRFFNSFAFAENKYPAKFVSTLDSTVFATVTYADSAGVMPSIFGEWGNTGYSATDDTGKLDKSYEAEEQTKFFNSQASSETIYLNYKKFQDFEASKDRDEFWNAKINDLTANGSLIVKEKKAFKKDSLEGYDVTLTDTGSSRAIKARMLLKNGTLYTIKLCMDTISKPSVGWVNSFLGYFQPIDSTIGITPFMNKRQLFMEYLNSGDSTRLAHAQGSINTVTFTNDDAPPLLKFMSSSAFKALDVDFRVSLIENLGTLENKAILPYLQKEYANASDTSKLQFAILEALAHQKSPKAMQALLQCLAQETPLSSDDYDVSYIFYPLYDSLQLAAQLYPGLLEYTRYPEYKDRIYELLATLVDSGLINKSVFEPRKSQVLREAGEELRRQLASDENMSGDASQQGDYTYNDEDYSYNGNSNLYNLTVLLTPFYSDPKVKTYFDKLNRIKDEYTRLDLSVLLLRYKLPVEDSVWKYFSASDAWRITLYNKLDNIKRLDKFDTSYKTQQHFARTILYGSTDPAKDSVQFIEKRWLDCKEGKGYVYFFKSKMGDDTEWQLDYVGLQPADTGKVNTTSTIYNKKSAYLSDNKTETEKKIDKKMKDLQLLGRKRVKADYAGYSYGYNGE